MWPCRKPTNASRSVMTAHFSGRIGRSATFREDVREAIQVPSTTCLSLGWSKPQGAPRVRKQLSAAGAVDDGRLGKPAPMARTFAPVTGGIGHSDREVEADLLPAWTREA